MPVETHTAEDHIEASRVTQRHKELYKSLEELVTCYVSETGHPPSKTTVMQLMRWSYHMKREPTCVRKESNS
jgi:hypothetical protein